MTRRLGVAHLTLLNLTPPEVVATAAQAGFDFVGLRVKAVTANERAYPMDARSPMLAETRLRLADTGLVVEDIEFLPLTAEVTADDWMPVLESGAALGATGLTVAGADPDRGRLTDTLARLTADAAVHGIRPLIEPISYQPLSSIPDAAALARATGAAVLVDPLHLQRGPSSVDDVAALEPSLLPVAQLCDGAALPPGPTVEDRLTEARRARRVIGQGDFPLDRLIAALPAHIPLSVEVPDAALQAQLTPREWAVLNARALRELLARADARAAASDPRHESEITR